MVEELARFGLELGDATLLECCGLLGARGVFAHESIKLICCYIIN